MVTQQNRNALTSPLGSIWHSEHVLQLILDSKDLLRWSMNVLNSKDLLCWPMNVRRRTEAGEICADLNQCRSRYRTICRLPTAVRHSSLSRRGRTLTVGPFDLYPNHEHPQPPGNVETSTTSSATCC